MAPKPARRQAIDATSPNFAMIPVALAWGIRMIEPLRRHLTIANTLAALALFVSLGGTVYAAQGRLSGTAIRPGSTPGNRLEPNSVTATQVKESSLKAVPLARMAEGFKGAGWGRVSAAGVLSASHNVSSITHTPGQGVYCIAIAGNDPSKSPMLVTLDGSDGDTTFGSGAILAAAQWFSQGGNCPAGTYEVRTGDFVIRSGRFESNMLDNAFSFFVP
jgi:hypothetical protein